MRAPAVVLSVVVLVLAVVPRWSRETRLALLGERAQMSATRIAIDPADPARRRVGGLTFLGGVVLASRDPAFGGFSAIAVEGDRFTLLSDGGNIVSFRMRGDWQPFGLRFANLPDGPGTGWDKRDRDAESLAIDPVTRQAWVGFEGSNAIWRYAPGFARAEAQATPAKMHRWAENGGPESLVRVGGGRVGGGRIGDGRFVTISETAPVPRQRWRGSEHARRRTRDALIFSGDPTARGVRTARFAYMPHPRYDPADAVQLPGGDLLILDRDFRLPFHWSNRLSIVPARAVRAGGVARGRTVAILDTPLIHDNFEGVAVTREGRDTVVWLVSDDNQMPLQRSLLLKFRLGCTTPKARPPR